jgi:hypothetical protein
MALRRVYNDTNFTLSPADAVVDGSLTVQSKNTEAQTTAEFFMSATGQAGVGNVAQITQFIEGGGGGDANGIIATRYTGNDFGVTITASTASTSPSNQFVVCTNGNVGIGKEPVSFAPGSLDISSALHLASAAGQVTADGSTPVVVPNTLVTASSKVFFSLVTAGGTLGVPTVSARVPGTSFSVESTNALDSSVYDYLIIN